MTLLEMTLRGICKNCWEIYEFVLGKCWPFAKGTIVLLPPILTFNYDFTLVFQLYTFTLAFLKRTTCLSSVLTSVTWNWIK
jgi:hypothetical protein